VSDYYSSNGRLESDDDQRAQHHSALCEDAALVVTLLELQGANDDADATKEIRAACTRILSELPFTPYVEPKIFKVDPIDLDDWLITCEYCKNGHIVHGPTWVKGGNPEEGSRSTRICPYCAEESLVVDRRPLWQKQKDRK
jgi:hypothetical protein